MDPSTYPPLNIGHGLACNCPTDRSRYLRSARPDFYRYAHTIYIPLLIDIDSVETRPAPCVCRASIHARECSLIASRGASPRRRGKSGTDDLSKQDRLVAGATPARGTSHRDPDAPVPRAVGPAARTSRWSAVSLRTRPVMPHGFGATVPDR